MHAQKIGGASHTHDIRNAETDVYFDYIIEVFVSVIALTHAQTYLFSIPRRAHENLGMRLVLL